jgi:flagellar FliJ protein
MTGPSFRFRLERVRAVRERKEKLAQQELAKAVSRRASTEEELRGAEADLEHARTEQRSVTAGAATVSATELQARQAFLERIETQRGLHAQELQRCETDVANRDAELASAASEHEMLNRLRERHRGEHDREMERRERNALDEIATIRFRRSPA